MSRRYSAEVEGTINELERWGCRDHWVEAGGKHTKVYYIWKGVEQFLVCAQTGSDHRGPDNARTEVRHALGVVGQKTHDKSRDRKPERQEAPPRRPEPPKMSERPEPFAKLADLLPKEEPVGDGVIIGAPPGDMRIRLVEVTPEMARDWLNDNTKNRPLRDARVADLVAAIQRGEWKLTHQAIAFDKDKVLLDGQHRLHAIVRAGKTVPVLVAFDADRASYDCLDIGARRSLADITGIGEKEASMLRFITQIVERDVGKAAGKVISPQQAERIWPYVRNAVKGVLAEAPSARRYVTVAPVMSAAAVRLVGGERHQYVLNLWRDIVMQNFRELPPVGESFLKQLINDSAKKRLSDYELFARSWYCFDEDNVDVGRIRIDDPADAILEAKGTLLAAMGMRIKEERK
jgi:hypothetical protein